MDAAVLQNGAVVWTGHVDGLFGAAQVGSDVFSLQAGDTLDFAVGSRGAQACDMANLVVYGTCDDPP